MHNEIKKRRNFARDYGFIFPDIRLIDNLDIKPRSYQIRIQGAYVASYELKLRNQLVIFGSGPKPSIIGEETTDPAFGMKALWIPDTMFEDARIAGYSPVDPVSVLLTHVSETMRNQLSLLLTYKDMRGLVDRLEPEYRRLIDDMIPNLITQSTLHSVLKQLLSERVSIRNL